MFGFFKKKVSYEEIFSDIAKTYKYIYQDPSKTSKILGDEEFIKAWLTSPMCQNVTMVIRSQASKGDIPSIKQMIWVAELLYNAVDGQPISNKEAFDQKVYLLKERIKFCDKAIELGLNQCYYAMVSCERLYSILPDSEKKLDNMSDEAKYALNGIVDHAGQVLLLKGEDPGLHDDANTLLKKYKVIWLLVNHNDTKKKADEHFIQGFNYHHGKGVEQDLNKAMVHYSKAAEFGHGTALHNIGHMYYHGQGVKKNSAEAFKWFIKAANNGYVDSQFNVGLMYEHGRGVPQDYEEAANWYQTAAVKGHATAQNNLASLYHLGKGVPQDYTAAAEWFFKAAEQGLPVSQFAIGKIYFFGEGVQPDIGETIKWYTKAAKQDFEPAKMALETIQVSLLAKNYLSLFNIDPDN